MLRRFNLQRNEGRKNVMGNFTPTKVKLRDLLADIDNGKIKLPSFQRDYKWTAPKVKKIIRFYSM